MKIAPLTLALAALALAPSFTAQAEKPKRDPAQLFKLFDRDGDGGVSFEEYKAGMAGQMDPSRVETTFKKKDADGDGKLSMTELMYVPPKATPAPKKEEKKAE